MIGQIDRVFSSSHSTPLLPATRPTIHPSIHLSTDYCLQVLIRALLSALIVLFLFYCCHCEYCPAPFRRLFSPPKPKPDAPPHSHSTLSPHLTPPEALATPCHRTQSHPQHSHTLKPKLSLPSLSVFAFSLSFSLFSFCLRPLSLTHPPLVPPGPTVLPLSSRSSLSPLPDVKPQRRQKRPSVIASAFLSLTISAPPR